MHTTTPTPPKARGFRLAGGVLMAIGVVVIIGWLADLPQLLSFRPADGVKTVFNTALCTLGSGFGFILLAAKRNVWARVAGVFVALLSGAVLLQFLSGLTLGVDEFAWHHQYINRTGQPGRMAVNSALGFLLTSGALLELTRRQPRHGVLNVVAGLVSAVALIPLVLYLAALLAGYTDVAYQGMAFPTAISLLVVAVTLLTFRPAEQKHGGWSLRFITAAAGMLASVGLMTVQSHGSFAGILGGVLAVAFIGLALASSLRASAARQAAEEGLRDANASLEGRVRERTVALQAVHDEVLGRERSLRFMADTMPQLIWTMRTGPTGPIETFNRSWEGYTGLSEAQSINNGWLGVIHPEDVPATLELWRRTKEQGVGNGGEHRMRRARDGAYRWHLWETRPERDAAGRVIGWVGTSTDIHDQKAAAEVLEQTVQKRTAELATAKDELEKTNQLQRTVLASLERSEQRFRQAFAHAGIGMAIVGLDGSWLQVNRVICHIVGYEEEDLLRKTFQDITHPADLNADLAHLADLLAGNIDHYQMEKRYLHRAGHIVHVRLTVSLVRDEAGAPVHFISQIEDITESKQFVASLAAARDGALAASRLKSEFLANMSHEIRTPMNGVIGMSDLLLDSPLTADQQQMGRVIRSSAENLLTIINDILDFSKIEAGKLSIEPQDFSLAEEIEQATSLLTPRARERGLTLTTELPADLPPGLSGDAGRIQQVLVNLVGNAVKFTEVGGVTVRVQSRSATHPGRYAFRTEVCDTGIGITPAESSRLFQPFTQADGSTTRKYGGTGLGLAISQQLVGLMDGRIGFESKVGQGSVFWFELELPVVAVPVGDPDPAGEPPAVARDPAMRILVAEDNAANQLVMRLLLQKTGLAFDIVADGHAVLERLAARDYAAVLMDCQMPQLDGYETTRRIRAQAGGVRQPRIPVIALTAHAMASDRDKCLEAGMDGYLAKPIRLEALREAFQRAGIFAFPESPEPATAAPLTSVLDAAQLAQLRELPGREGGTLLDDLIGMALRDLPPEIARLHEAVARRDGMEVTQLAHRLAGSAANLGAVGLRQSLQELEYAGRQAEWPAADRGRLALDREWESAREALQSLQGTPS